MSNKTYKIVGASLDTGDDIVVEIDALNEDEARAIAKHRRIAISSITSLETQIYPPTYRRKKRKKKNRTLTYSMIGLGVLAIVAISIGLVVAMPNTSLKGASENTNGQKREEFNKQSTRTPRSAPKISEIFHAQAIGYLKEAGHLNALTEQGVNIIEYSKQLAVVRSELDLLIETWPDGFAPDSLASFQKSLKAHSLAVDLWRMKIDKSDTPTEPSINGWHKFQEFKDDRLLILTRDENFIVSEYRGRKYIPFENVGYLCQSLLKNLRSDVLN